MINITENNDKNLENNSDNWHFIFLYVFIIYHYLNKIWKTMMTRFQVADGTDMYQYVLVHTGAYEYVWVCPILSRFRTPDACHALDIFKAINLTETINLISIQ
jgi:hypothetical protein